MSYDVIAQSAEEEHTTLAKLREVGLAQERPLGDRPVVVLTRGIDSSPELRDVHARLTRLSTNARHTVVASAGHEIHLFQPDAVIQAIRDVLEAVRTRKPRPPR